MYSTASLAQALSTVTGLPISYFVNDCIETAWPTTEEGAESKQFIEWVQQSILNSTPDHSILLLSDGITLSRNEYFYFFSLYNPLYLIAGPFFIRREDRENCLEEFSHAEFFDTIAALRVVEMKYLNATALLASFNLHDEKSQSMVGNQDEEVPPSEAQALFMKRMTTDTIAFRYGAERHIRQCIMAGNSKEMLRLLASLDNPAHMAPDRPIGDLREQKTYLHSLNTICRLSAEAAGLSDLQLDTISHNLRKKVERAKTRDDLVILIKELATSYCDAVEDNSMSSNSYAIKKIKKFIVENIGADLSLEKLAAMVNVNPSYLSRLFKKECGITISQFIRNQKIREAKWMLAKMDIPIIEISEALGFEYSSYFSHTFKKATGISATQYRMKYGQGRVKSPF